MGHRAKKVTERKCRNCGNGFMPRHGHVRYCSDQCKLNIIKKNKREAYATAQEHLKPEGFRYFPKSCVVCGDIFQPTSGRSSHCVKCRRTKQLSHGDFVSSLLRACKIRRYTSELTRAWFETQWERQGGLCALTRIPMKRERDRGAGNIIGRDGTKVSIDRIDADKGYLISNCRLVCVIVNIMRNRMSDDDLFKWCALLLAERERVFSVFEKL